MSVSDTLSIDLKEIEEEGISLDLSLDNEFFKALDEHDELVGGEVRADVKVERQTSEAFILNIHVRGLVRLLCDRCLDEMTWKIENQDKYIVKLSDKFSGEGDMGDDIIFVDKENGLLELSWILFESVMLDIPIQHSHDEGECNEEMIKILDSYSSRNNGAEVDPRFQKLKEININN